MLSRVLSRSSCAACKFCCSFRRQSLWETPLFPPEVVEKLSKPNEYGVVGEFRNGQIVLGPYLTAASEEEVQCTFLDPEKGCILKGEDKPFDCSIWPLRIMDKEGELVISTLSKKAMPILRYRTRDITAIEKTKCKCGRTIRRIRRIGRRSDDMIIMRGVNVFPSQIETALLRAEKALPHYQIVLDTKNNMDTLEVKVEVSRDMVSDSMGAMEQLNKKFKHSIEQILGISVIVTLCEPDSLPRSEGKAKRVIDNRKKM